MVNSNIVSERRFKMKNNRNFLIVLSLILMIFVFSSTLVFAEDNSTNSNSTNSCVEKTYLECGTSKGIPVSVNVKILANCDKV